MLLTLETPINKFFDNVLVKDKDLAIANNRILLLQDVKKLFLRIARFDAL
jgi:glycyl-tRNA synthetase beta chain